MKNGWNRACVIKKIIDDLFDLASSISDYMWFKLILKTISTKYEQLLKTVKPDINMNNTVACKTLIQSVSGNPIINLSKYNWFWYPEIPSSYLPALDVITERETYSTTIFYAKKDSTPCTTINTAFLGKLSMLLFMWIIRSINYPVIIMITSVEMFIIKRNQYSIFHRLPTLGYYWIKGKFIVIKRLSRSFHGT